MAMKPYYEQDGITIFWGDCRDVLPTLGAVDLVLTDPPYKHEHTDGGGFASVRHFYGGTPRNERPALIPQSSELVGLSEFDLSIYGAVLLQAAPMLIAFHSRDLVPDYASLARSACRKYDLHVWHKVNAIPFTANTWKSDVEYIALVWEKKPGWNQRHQSLHSKVWTSGRNVDPSHPTAKPVDLLRKYIDILDASVTLDPFMGSGTTLRAAKDLGRKAIGIEIEERYCEIAAKRLAQQVLFTEAS